MKKLVSIFFVIAVGLAIFSSCNKEDKEQTYQTYAVEYLLRNNMDNAKRFTIII